VTSIEKVSVCTAPVSLFSSVTTYSSRGTKDESWLTLRLFSVQPNA